MEIATTPSFHCNDDDEENPVKIVDEDIYFDGEIDVRASTHLSIAIRQMEKKKKEMINKKQIIYMSTPGGSAFSSLHLYDVFRKSILEIEAIIQGEVCSGGTIMMCGAKLVSMYENSYIMLHELSSYSEGRFHQQQVDLALNQSIMDKIIRIYQEKTGGQTINQDWLKVDRYLTAREALDLRLIDKIL